VVLMARSSTGPRWAVSNSVGNLRKSCQRGVYANDAKSGPAGVRPHCGYRM
jgi:hypothetical protein